MLRILESLTVVFGDSPMERLSMSSFISNGGKIILKTNNFMAVIRLPLLFLPNEHNNIHINIMVSSKL
jgi:hypothetical protein